MPDLIIAGVHLFTARRKRLLAQLTRAGRNTPVILLGSADGPSDSPPGLGAAFMFDRANALEKVRTAARALLPPR